ncbi:hypothetical protein [Tepidimonas taiwanensis]|uniref:hypothetical protein n=1 Tax=Tepidimonas taiwanensis TaxID=307486 RepID=UPI000733F6FD|nr:hypothetical protein [Tepidimonas taiwanensis]
MTLDDIAVILGCSKPTASQIRSGKYPTENTSLTERYARLVAVVEAARRAAALDPQAICRACPREDCTGCRVAEMV